MEYSSISEIFGIIFIVRLIHVLVQDGKHKEDGIRVVEKPKEDVKRNFWSRRVSKRNNNLAEHPWLEKTIKKYNWNYSTAVYNNELLVSISLPGKSCLFDVQLLPVRGKKEMAYTISYPIIISDDQLDCASTLIDVINSKLNNCELCMTQMGQLFYKYIPSVSHVDNSSAVLNEVDFLSMVSFADTAFPQIMDVLYGGRIPFLFKREIQGWEQWELN